MEDIIPKDYPDFKEHGTPPCAESYPDAFFTEERSVSVVSENGKVKEKSWAKYYFEVEAKAICAECPYKVRCLEYALKTHEIGIWGGTTERERKAIRKARNSKSNRQERTKVQ